MKRIQFGRFIVCWLLGAFFAVMAESVTIVYPDVKAPYDKIFQQITQGIESHYQGKVIHLKVPAKFSANSIAEQIATEKVIALGKRGLIVAKQVYTEKPVVVGALPIKPSNVAGVSLMASPEALFESLQQLAPRVKKVTVLYSDASAWIIELAKVEATKLGLTLNPIAVDDIRSAVKSYDDIFKGDNLKEMAIWLPLDPVTANDKVIVPVILEKAWENKLVVFSSKPSHAKRGALFSAIPDNIRLGEQLAQMVKTVNYDARPSVVKPLSDIDLAVNLRTAAHLGYNYSATEQAEFSLTFPE
ncbi:ABC transporter substrate-binding protein [Thalassotalea sp. PLHSN55]|uniref:ABC transporter substrate-binding protein n=1 Tax=Thalassotalea sp. PLHSN55 TaxID=3435888 RepID=UPI003F868F3D